MLNKFFGNTRAGLIALAQRQPQVLNRFGNVSAVIRIVTP